MRSISLAVAVAMLVFCSAAAAATVPVTQLSGDFGATNPSVASTNDGVQFGVYANGGSAGGSLYYRGANGLTLSQITALGFSESHNTTNDSPISAPYLRVFLEDQDADGLEEDVIFDPTECATIVPAENTSNHFDVVGGDVRYDDDGCDGVPPDQQPWATVIAAHGGEIITGIYISAGFTGGDDLSALVTDLTVNSTTFCFNCQPTASGPVVTTTFVREPARVNTAASTLASTAKNCTANVRKLHAPKRRGLLFLTTRASLRGKALRVNGRTITVNLTNKPEGNYNVRLTSRYRRHSGKVVTIKTTRNLSVACS
ncbi:MAG TPA: hypothetical protein VF257_10680 [Solirubrobacteraceae bacterium]